jgi:hypothetical protein
MLKKRRVAAPTAAEMRPHTDALCLAIQQSKKLMDSGS